MITIVDMNLIPSLAPLISEVLYEKIRLCLAEGQKILLSLNRRGAMSTLVCRDCGWTARCPACDLSMRVHHTPRHFLLCHFCEGENSLPQQCPKCHGFHLIQSGARVQTAETSVRQLFPEASVLLIEKGVDDLSQASLENANIFIGTQKITSLPIQNLGLAAFLLVEADLSVPMYDIEEDMYGQVKYLASRAPHVVLQTRSPKIRFLETIQKSNFRDFFTTTLAERRQFRLPPYTEMVAISISEKSEDTLRSRVQVLASNFIRASENTGTSVSYDHLLIERRGGEYFQKILIKSDDIQSFLEPFRSSLVKSRGVEVRWL